MKKVSINQLFQKSTKRVRILVSVFSFAIGIIFFAYYISVVNPSFAKAYNGAGKGSQNDPFQVTNCEQLQSIGNTPNGYNYVLMNDIDCSDTVNWNNGEGFRPIYGYSDGIFDGRNHVITDLFINRPNTYAVGLFSEIGSNAIIKNIQLEKSPQNAGRIDINGARYVGALTGGFKGALIYNVHSSINVQSNGRATDNGGDVSNMAVGGLVGTSYSVIDKSSSTGNVTVASNNLPDRSVSIGGLVGAVQPSTVQGTTLAKVTNSYATGAVSAGTNEQTPSGNCGGLIGYFAINQAESTKLEVSASYASGSVTCINPNGGTPNTGGLLGAISIDSAAVQVPEIVNNFATGQIGYNGGFKYGLYGAYFKGNNPAVANPDLSSNKYDAYRSGANKCGARDDISCEAVNIANSEPDYFTQSNVTNFFNTWDQTSNWVLSTPYPIHTLNIVRPTGPLNLSVVRDGNSFVTSWEDPIETNGRYDNIKGYQLYYRDNGNKGDWIHYDPLNLIVGTTTKTISDLPIPGNYSFKVRALSQGQYDDIIGLFSAAKDFATGMPAATPSNIQLNPNAKSIAVSWEAVDAATAYQVQYRKQSTTDWLNGALVSSTSARITGLENTTNYDIRVVARNIAGNGPWSESFSTTTTAQVQYNVANCQQLQDISNDLDGIYTQTANIDCSAVPSFAVIGGVGGVFQGSYDGRGLTISNVTISSDIEAETTDWVGVGLFGAVDGGVLTNLILKDSTVIGNYKLSEVIDADGNGLPDEPELPGLPSINPVVEVPTTINDAGEIVQDNGGIIADGASEFGGNATTTAYEYGINARQFPSFSVGGVAGAIIGTGSYSNIQALNTVVQGSMAGGVFGSVIPSNFIKSLVFSEYEDPQTALLEDNGTLTLDNIRSSGSVNGFIAGGIVGAGMPSVGGVIGLDSQLTISNSLSSSEVQANIGGGILGFGLSPATFSTIPVVLQAISVGSNPQGSQELIDASDRTFNAQSILIEKSTFSGLVTTCNAPSEVRIGSLGGIVGLATAAHIESAEVTGDVTTCSASPDSRLAYGGAVGGVAGILLSSRIENSNASGDIRAIRNTGEYENDSGNYLGVAGGLAGIFLDGRDDSDGDYSILNNTTSGVIDIYGKNGLFSISGGAIGLNIGNATIKDTKSSRNIATATAQENVGALSISGGMTGLTIGIDGNLISQLGTNPVANPTLMHGADIDNSYATGDITTIKNGKSGMLAVTGGMTGLFIGSGTIKDSHATGTVISTIPNKLDPAGIPQPNTDEDPNAFVASLAPAVLGTNFGTAISGGMIGSAFGIDSARIATIQLAVVSISSPENIKTGQGLRVNNSYATGDVQANVAGGLMGTADLKVEIEKTYTEGDIRGEIVGGLIGQSGLGSTALLSGAAYFANYVTGGGFTNPDGTFEQVGIIFDGNLAAIGPVSINNTYATGSITAASYIVDVTTAFGANAEGSLPIMPVRLPTIAGGVVGLYAVPGGLVTNTYSSGSITVLPLPERAQNIKIADIPSFAGAVFGMHLAIPIPSFQKILQDVESSENTPPQIGAYLNTPNKVENVFSVSTMNLTDKTFTGGTSGIFISPFSFLNNLVLGFNSSDLDVDKLYVTKNIYFDASKVNVEGCNAPYTQASGIVKKLFKDSYIPNSEGTNIIPTIPADEDLTPEGAATQNAINDQFIQTACQFVNNNNEQPNYFKNNKVNAPLNNWNFSDVWVVRKDDYPKFVAGATTDEPGGKPITDVTNPTPTNPAPTRTPRPTRTPTPNNSITDTSTFRSVNTVNGILRKQIEQLGFVTNDKQQVKGLKTYLANVPVFIAQSIPYLLILALLIVATLYSVQALKQYRQLSVYHANIMRILTTKESVDNYLAITTHYLNTPVAIMNGSVELLLSLKKITTARADALTNKIKKFSTAAEQLLVANQVSGAQAVNDEKILKHDQINPLKSKQVLIPAIIALGLIGLANALFIYADVFNTSAFRIGIEIGLFALSVLLVALAYRYRDYLETTKLLAMEQLKLESELYKKRETFIPQAASVTSEHLESLQITGKSLEKIPEAKLFFNGLAMLEGINKGLIDLSTFAEFNSDPPLFDITTYARKSVDKFKTKAKDKNVKIESNVDHGLVSRIQPEEIRQLIDSLLENAVKFSNDNSTVSLSIYRRFNRIVISVSDKGIGISEHKLPSLLKPFSRGTDSMQYNYEGIGLGLYADKIIIDKLGGTISIRSKLGEGTTTTVSIPSRSEAAESTPVLIMPDITPA